MSDAANSKNDENLPCWVAAKHLVACATSLVFLRPDSSDATSEWQNMKTCHA